MTTKQTKGHINVTDDSAVLPFDAPDFLRRLADTTHGDSEVSKDCVCADLRRVATEFERVRGIQQSEDSPLKPVYEVEIHQCAACHGMIAPGNACFFSVKAYCSDACSRTQQANRPTRNDAIDLIEIANRMDYLRAKFDLPNEHEFEGMAKGIREIAEAVQRGE